MDATDETSENRTETTPDPLFELIGSITRLTRRVALNADQLAEQVVSDAGSVARDAEAFGRAAAAGWSKLQRTGQTKWRDLGRAAPRVARVTTEGGKLIALYQWHRLLAQAGGHGLPDEAHRKLAIRAREACVELRGGVLKLGQILSCRPDLVGPIWAGELAELQDRVPPVDADAIIAGIEAELGAPIGELFAEFSREPVAAASLAQVHLARLADGREVAVKALVPGIEDVIDADIAAMRALGPMLSDVIPGADLATIVAEMSRSLREELDYRAEADAARELGALLGVGTLFVPEIIASHSAQRVMTMARVDGARLGDHLDAADAAERSRVIAAMVEGVARQVFVHGLVHADPHPGNFLITADGRVAVLDFGCVLRLGADERRGYARALGALVSRDATAAADALATLGFVGDRDALLAVAGRVVDALRPGVDASAIDWQEAFRGLTADLAAVGKAGGVTVPRSFVLLGRVLATVAGLIVQYKPKLEPFALLAPSIAVALRT